MNNWVDSNCFFTVGKAIMNNVVMYRDIFEQKGPILYFLHALAYLISQTTFTGVYLIEIISCAVLLFIFYKTIQLFVKSDWILIVIPVIAAIVYSSRPFFMGDSAEELCLPCLALSNYFFTKALLNNQKLKRSEWFLIGISSGFVLWVKFSLLGYYIGFGIFAAIVYLKNKWIKDAVASVLMLVAGIGFISIPVFVYFVKNNALKDLFEVYFYDNLFLYSVNEGGNKLIEKAGFILNGINSFFYEYLMGGVVLFFGLMFLSLKNRKIFFLNLLTLFSLIFSIYSGGRNYEYYSFIFTVYFPFGFTLLCSVLNQTLNKKKPVRKGLKYAAEFACFVLCFSLAYVFSMNTYMLKYEKSSLPQYKFDEIISKEENPTLLDYGKLDGGFYTVSNIVPTCKYFCGLNIDYDEITKVQNYYVENALTDFVITRDEVLDEKYLDDYECADTQKFEYRKGYSFTYYLYKKK